MSQNTEKPKTTKARIEPKIPDSVIMEDKACIHTLKILRAVSRSQISRRLRRTL